MRQVDHETYELLKKIEEYCYLEDRGKPIADFARLKGNSFESSGGLKLSDSKEMIGGSFVIQDDQIIYDSGIPFFKERDTFVYTNGADFYTEMSMVELLKEKLQIKTKYLIYMGKKVEVNPYRCEDIFEEVSAEEMLEYATNPGKGQYVLRTRRYF